MKHPIWRTDEKGRKWVQSVNLWNSSHRFKLFPEKYFEFTNTGVQIHHRGTSEEHLYFDLEGRNYPFGGAGLQRYSRPIYWTRLLSLPSLEGDIETDEISDPLGWVGFTRVVLPTPPPWCGTCAHGYLGNHHDEPCWCDKVQTSVGRQHGVLVCPLWEEVRR